MPSGPGMSHNRYMELSNDLALHLTKAEYDAGWHFCFDWDGMLIHKDWPEADCCTCRKAMSSPQGDKG